MCATLAAGCDCATFGYGGYNDQDVALTRPLADVYISTGESIAVDMDAHWTYEAGDACTVPLSYTPPIAWVELSSDAVEARVRGEVLLLKATRQNADVLVRMFGREEVYSTSSVEVYAKGDQAAQLRMRIGEAKPHEYPPAPLPARGLRAVRIRAEPAEFAAGDTLHLIAEVVDAATGAPAPPRRRLWTLDDGAVYVRTGRRAENSFSFRGHYYGRDTLSVYVREGTEVVQGLFRPDDRLSDEALVFRFESQPSYSR
jgi:hypothetical protein